jgi:hypothetical protein
VTLCISGIEEERKTLYKLRRTIEGQMHVSQSPALGSHELRATLDEPVGAPLRDPDENILFLSFDEEYIMDELEKSFYVESPGGANEDLLSSREIASKNSQESGGALAQRVKDSPVKFVSDRKPLSDHFLRVSRDSSQQTRHLSTL